MRIFGLVPLCLIPATISGVHGDFKYRYIHFNDPVIILVDFYTEPFWA